MNNLKVPWLIRYNPLYVISVVCLLYGVYQLNLSLLNHNIGYVDQIMSMVNEFYQLILIGAVAFLLRILKETRSALFISGLGFFMALDPTYIAESFSSNGAIGYFSSIVWLILFGVKLIYYEKLNDLEIAKEGIYIFLIGFAFITISPHLLVENVITGVGYKKIALAIIHLLAMLMIIFKPFVSKFSKSMNTQFNLFIYGGFGLMFFRHMWIQFDSYNVGMGTDDFLILALLPLYFMRNKKESLGYGLAVLALLAGTEATSLATYIYVAAMSFYFFQYKDQRFIIVGVLGTWILVRFAPELKNHALLVDIIYAAILYAGGFLTKVKTYFIPATFLVVAHTYDKVGKVDSELVMSLLYVFGGFAALIIALGMHWYYLREKEK